MNLLFKCFCRERSSIFFPCILSICKYYASHTPIWFTMIYKQFRTMNSRVFARKGVLFTSSIFCPSAGYICLHVYFLVISRQFKLVNLFAKCGFARECLLFSSFFLCPYAAFIRHTVCLLVICRPFSVMNLRLFARKGVLFSSHIFCPPLSLMGLTPVCFVVICRLCRQCRVVNLRVFARSGLLFSSFVFCCVAKQTWFEK